MAASVYGNYQAKVNFPEKTDYLQVQVDIIAQLQPINPFDFLLDNYAVNYPFIYPPNLAKQLTPFLEITSESNLRCIGGCTYYVNPPNGSTYQQFPVNRREAESRMIERFVPTGHTPGKITLTGLSIHPEYPLTLDLRWLL